ncbi:MAG: hypothetical protein WC966_09795 [Bradymonadales bacterium]
MQSSSDVQSLAGSTHLPSSQTPVSQSSCLVQELLPKVPEVHEQNKMLSEEKR